MEEEEMEDLEDVEEEEEEIFQRRSSVAIARLNDQEQEFFALVSAGNVAEVQDYLERLDINVNATDFQGRSALHIAVRESNLPMVQYLLSVEDIDPVDAHLYAIRDNQAKIAMVIMNKMNELSPGGEYDEILHSADFPDGSTPLMVAAQYGHFDLIGTLIERRHYLPPPHVPSCVCEECMSDRERLDILTIAKRRLFAYKAIINPAYMCQTQTDPILKAFELSHELDDAATFDREFYHEYKKLSEEVGQFATDLIGCTRTTDEVEIILKQTTGFAHSSKFEYPRLLFALYFEQRAFVAHPNVQQLVESKWIEGWYDWKNMSYCKKCLRVILRIIMLPVIVMVILVSSKSKWGAAWQTPVNKFLSSVGSYLVFLLFVFLQSNTDKTDQLRGPPATGYEYLLVIYIISFAWAAFRLCFQHGPKKYFSTPSYQYELAMIILFILTFLFWIAAAIDVRLHDQRELERKYWHKFDPTLVAEGVYTLATIMAFFKLLFICQLDYHLGPLQQSLCKMVKDVSKFMILFGIITGAFAAGLSKLYQYYDGMVQIDDKSKIKTQQVSSFVDFSSSLKTLFWALFCMSPIESADVIIENLPGDSEAESVINYHTFTQSVGYIAFAGFSFISVIVALNMLIACMSNTFTMVNENVTVEWTYGRTQTYVDYMLTTALPPPFNLIPTPAGMGMLVEYIKILMKPSEGKRAKWDLTHCFFIEVAQEDKDDMFELLMSQLVQRYFRQKSREDTESEFDKLRQELMEVKSLLRDALSPA